MVLVAIRSMKVVCVLTDHGPGYYPTEATRHEYRQGVGMGTISTEGCQELLATLIGHKIDAGTQRISHY